MNCKKIAAIVRTADLDRLEQRLKTIGVKGMSVHYITGFGEHFDVFSPGRLVRHVKIEIWAREDEVDKIVEAIVAIAHTGKVGDGMIAIFPVEKIIRIRTKQEATAEEV